MFSLSGSLSNGNHQALHKEILRTCRWHRQRKLDSAELLSKSDLIILLSASSLESGIYNHVLACSIPPRRVNTDPILSIRDAPIFGADFTHYVPKSRCWSWRTLLSNGQVWRGLETRKKITLHCCLRKVLRYVILFYRLPPEILYSVATRKNHDFKEEELNRCAVEKKIGT